MYWQRIFHGFSCTKYLFCSGRTVQRTAQSTLQNKIYHKKKKNNGFRPFLCIITCDTLRFTGPVPQQKITAARKNIIPVYCAAVLPEGPSGVHWRPPGSRSRGGKFIRSPGARFCVRVWGVPAPPPPRFVIPAGGPWLAVRCAGARARCRSRWVGVFVPFGFRCRGPAACAARFVLGCVCRPGFPPLPVALPCPLCCRIGYK